MEDNIDATKQSRKVLKIYLLSIFVVLITIFTYVFNSPFNNKDILIHIKDGESISTLSTELLSKDAIRSELVFKIFLKIIGKKSGIISGDYLIKKNTPIWTVSWQVGRGHHNVEPIKVTIKEGLSNDEIASLLADNLTGFRKDLFISGALQKQGFLFPDTYYLYSLDTADEIIQKLSTNFKNRTKNLDLSKSDKSLSEIITMASILEGEAAGKDDAGIISGILWKRIAMGMPLQVDTDKSTYASKGLPALPLNNPGLITINAALNPIDSPYLYYLHDKNGKVHYAVTFAEHKRNISNYLK